MDEGMTPHVGLSRADQGARLSALLIDLMLLGVAAVVAMFGTIMASAPFWEVNGQTHSTAGAGSAVLAMNDTVPRWVGWVVVVILAVSCVVLSGALARPGSRRSFGLVFAELCLARVGEVAVVDADPLDPAEHWRPASVEPARWRVAARWLLPLTVFAVLVPLTSGLVAGLVTVGGWVPAVLGSRRSVYDRIAGVTVIDPVRSIRRAQDAAKAKRRRVTGG